MVTSTLRRKGLSSYMRPELATGLAIFVSFVLGWILSHALNMASQSGPVLRQEEAKGELLIDRAEVDIANRGFHESNCEKLDLNTTVRPGTVLILTPVKNAWKHLDRYFSNIQKMSYPHDRISIAFLDSDSDDHGAPAGTTTLGMLKSAQHKLRGEFRRISIFEQHYGLSLSRSQRHDKNKQVERRAVLARSRNQLAARAIQDEEWVLWIDSDLQSYPADIIERLTGPRKDIVIPNCVMGPGQRSYDLNSWKRPQPPPEYEVRFPAMDASAQALSEMTTKQLLEACGAQLRLTKGLPSSRETAFPSPENLQSIAAAIESEMVALPSALATMTDEDWAQLKAKASMPIGLGTCLRETALRAAGMSAKRKAVAKYGGSVGSSVELECREHWAAPADDLMAQSPGGAASVSYTTGAGSQAGDGPEVLLEGYGFSGNKHIHKLRGDGSKDLLVEIDSVGGAMLLVRADLHRDGLVFPPFPYRRYIETEGLAMMARDMGARIYALPNVEVIHH